MEISASSQADYRVYASAAPETLYTAVRKEETKVDEIPSRDPEYPEKQGSNSEKEPSIPLSSNANVRAYVSTADRAQTESEPTSDGNEESGGSTDVESSSSEEAPDSASTGELTPEEEQLVAKLKARDQEVRQHEQAHLAAAGSYAAGGAQFQYQTGPDGKQYAIGGHVNIDTSSESSPEATIAKAQQVQRAALAPADPSPQDIKVAAQAYRMMAEAQRELAEQKASEGEDESNGIAVSVRGVQNAVGRLEDMGNALNSESF